MVKRKLLGSKTPTFNRFNFSLTMTDSHKKNRLDPVLSTYQPGYFGGHIEFWALDPLNQPDQPGSGEVCLESRLDPVLSTYQPGYFGEHIQFWVLDPVNQPDQPGSTEVHLEAPLDPVLSTYQPGDFRECIRFWALAPSTPISKGVLIFEA